MRPRHPRFRDSWPSTWLLTDERQGDALWTALRRLPRGSGVVVRHYSLNGADRGKLFKRVLGIARARRLIVLLGSDPTASPQPLPGEGRGPATIGPILDPGLRRGTESGIYLGSPAKTRTKPATAIGVHDLKEIRQAERNGASLLLLSPLFPTRSHPEGKTLGIPRFAALAKATRLPVIALGGVDARHARLLARIGAYGWAGIDAFIRKARKGRIRT